MTDWLLAHEPTVRLSVFLGVFAAVAAWEALAPRRALAVGRWARWPNNIGVVVLNTVVARLLFPAGAVGIAAWATGRNVGLFNVLDMPPGLEIAVAFLLLDLAIYLQHRVFHAVPALWRLHRMHHADLGFDVTTGARFHPIEIVLSMIIKAALVAALGAPIAAVILFEVVLNGTAMFNHANAGLPPMVERVVRLFVVTPDMHRVHHSVVRTETDSNFGFCLPWWDRLFRTYRAQPAAGHGGMTIGIASFRDPADLRLDKMLIQPFRDGA
ncbi:MAG: sterol desaturase family protein [Alphaproteobacteria bacterium]|nr:sterol desaturase family protein [Alphaproteobacteria bacterium]